MIEKVKERLKTLGYEATEDDDFLINYAIDKIQYRVKFFTNLNEVPEALEKEVIDAICGDILSFKLIKGDLDVERAVQSITEGDVTVNYGSNNDPVTLLQKYYNGLNLRDSVLIAFRVFKW